MSSRFETLPREVREKIYEFYSEDIVLFSAVVYGKDTASQRTARTVVKPADVSKGHKKTVSLVSVSKTINCELFSSLIRFKSLQVRHLQKLFLFMSYPMILPSSVVAKLRVLHVTADFKYLGPMHAKHLAFPCLKEVTIEQDPAENIPIFDPGFPYRKYPAWMAANYVHEIGKDSTIATIDRVVQTKGKIINRAFFGNLLSCNVSFRLVIPFGSFKARNKKTGQMISGNTVVATTETIRTAAAEENEDDKEKKEPGWEWTATKTEFTEASRLFKEFTEEAGEHLAVCLNMSWSGL